MQWYVWTDNHPKGSEGTSIYFEIYKAQQKTSP